MAAPFFQQRHACLRRRIVDPSEYVLFCKAASGADPVFRKVKGPKGIHVPVQSVYSPPGTGKIPVLHLAEPLPAQIRLQRFPQGASFVPIREAEGPAAAHDARLPVHLVQQNFAPFNFRNAVFKRQLGKMGMGIAVVPQDHPMPEGVHRLLPVFFQLFPDCKENGLYPLFLQVGHDLRQIFRRHVIDGQESRYMGRDIPLCMLSIHSALPSLEAAAPWPLPPFSFSVPYTACPYAAGASSSCPCAGSSSVSVFTASSP